MSAAQQAAILPYCHYLIERFSVGRDFGAYKRGLIWLKEKGKLPNADILVLANDSMFYPSSVSETVSEMLSLSEDWVTLFENFQFQHHAQSFFLLLRGNVFQSSCWRRFWDRYRPYSSRLHCIEKGEKKLSSTLLKGGFFPHAIYNSVRVTTTLRSLIEADNTRSDRIAELLLRLHGDSRAPLQRYNKRNRLIEDAILNLGSTMHHLNPTHAAGIIINVSLTAPLKRDLCYRGTYDLTQVVSSVRGFTDKELQAMISDLRRRGFPASMVWGPRKALYAFGRI